MACFPDGHLQEHLSLMRMHRYFIKTPWIARKIFPQYVWRLPARDNEVFLTFDDGPHPEITPWVLDMLKAYNARATFFCIGNNVEQFPEVYQRIINEGHAVGNHTFHHLNGWKTNETLYLEDIARAAGYIHSDLFRPPYGRIRTSQASRMQKTDGLPSHVIMWDVLSGDFDHSISTEQCFLNVAQHVQPGSIIVFHDSEKARTNLEWALPRVLELLKRQQYQMKKISL